MHFSRRNITRLRHALLSILLLLMSWMEVSASFKGTYTINRLAPASATNYRSFSALIGDLSTGNRSDSFDANGPGISGNVILSVTPGSGPYYERISFPVISGTSASQGITLKGNNELLAFNTQLGALAVVQLNGVDFLVIDSLQIHALGSVYGRCVEIMNESNQVSIENCRLKMPSMTGTSDYNGYVMITNGTTRPSVFTNPGRNIQIRKNHMSAMVNGGPYYGIWMSQVQGASDTSGYIIEDNEIEDVYYAFIYASYTVSTLIKGNILHNSNHNRPGYIYGIYLYNYLTPCDANISSNKLYDFNNASTGLYDGRYPVYVYMYGSNNTKALEITNNIIDLRCTYYTPGIYVYALNASNSHVKFYYNTLNFDGKVKNSYIYGLYMTQMYYANLDCKNNIFSCNWELSGPLYACYFVPGSLQFDHNLMHLSDITGSGSVFYGYNGTSFSTFKDWNTAVNGFDNLTGNPLFTDPNNHQWLPQSLWICNKGTPVSTLADIEGKSRHLKSPDLGAHEYSLDLALLKVQASDSNVCSNDPVNVKVLVKNLSQFTLRQIPLTFAINNENEVLETFTSNLKPGDSTWYSFNAPAFFHNGSNSFLVARLNGLDDLLSNNSANLIIQVSESPHGGSILPTSPFEGYAFTGEKSNPDIAIPGNKLVYEIKNPLKYDNNRFDSTWKMSFEWRTLSGALITSGLSFVPPKGSKYAQVILTPDSTLEDSLIYLNVKTSSFLTQCDTSFGRFIYVLPVPDVSFKANNVCKGEVAVFENQTQVVKGELLYHWDFGDPLNAADTSAGFNPIYLYAAEGSYTANLNVKLKKYPKFSFGTSRSITVNPMPAVDYLVQNACEGETLQFLNQTVVKVGNPALTKYEWDFGDQLGKSLLISPPYLYQNAGGYKVTLTATYEGCKNSITKNANQFANPKAAFQFTGNCSETSIQFKNETTIKMGKSGFIWQFGDGDQSFLSDPSHTYHKAGQYDIVLQAISEFGCKDSIRKTIFLKESPLADFEFDQTCSNRETQFYNKSDFPSGFEVQYLWDFNGEKYSNQTHPVYLFNGLGGRYVNLKVKSSNGCENNITKYPVIKRKASANFEAKDACEGESVFFTNKSTVDQGSLYFEWRFGDNSTSSLTSPRKFYSINGNTATYLVTLLAKVPDGCSDSITLPVTVNAKTNPNFDAKSAGRFVKFTPAISDNALVYNWNFGEGSRSNDVSPLHEYNNIDQGTFEACLGIINTAGCLSEYCKEISIDLVGLNDQKILNPQIYPNPANRNIHFQGMTFDAFSITDLTGKLIKQHSSQQILIDLTLDVSQINNGLYFLSFYQNGVKVYSRSFVVSHE